MSFHGGRCQLYRPESMMLLADLRYKRGRDNSAQPPNPTIQTSINLETQLSSIQVSHTATNNSRRLESASFPVG